jgi:hypothetical protein
MARTTTAATRTTRPTAPCWQPDDRSGTASTVSTHAPTNAEISGPNTHRLGRQPATGPSVRPRCAAVTNEAHVEARNGHNCALCTPHRHRTPCSKTMPVFGPVFRWGDRVSGGLGWKISAEYEKWIREHGVEDPHRKEE